MPRVAAIQMTSGCAIERNLEIARKLLERAAGAGAALAVLPENFALMAESDARRAAQAETPGQGPIQAMLASAARELGIWIVAGTLPMRSVEPDRPTASCLVLDSQGRQVARYDKIHLFDVDLPDRQERYRESANTLAGTVPVSVDTPVGRLGLSVCYDLRFPELYRDLVAQGATTLCVPSAFTTPTGRSHWEILVRARAIENQCYLIAAAQSGLHENGRETYGGSVIVDPWGAVLTRLPRGSGIAVADIDAERCAALRRRFPVLTHRRLGL